MSLITKYGLEAIDFQDNSRLFRELTTALKSITDDKTMEYIVSVEKRIEDVIKTSTGLKTRITFSSINYMASAWTYPMIPDNGTSPLLNVQYDFNDYYSKYDFASLVAKKDGIGKIDLVNSTVDGIFKQVEVPIIFTRKLFNLLKPDELAAVIIHEIGHTFTYLETINDIIRTNYVLKEANKELRNSKKKSHQIKIIKQIANDQNIDIDDPDVFVNGDKEELLKILTIDKKFQETRSEMGAEEYDLTTYEYLSDQFAARHGAGRSLVSALDKLNRHYGDASTSSYGEFLFVSIMDLAGSTTLSNFTSGLFLLITLSISGRPNSEYDNPKDRMIRIRQDMVVQLKNKDLPKGLSIRLKEDLKSIDRKIELITNKTALVDKLLMLVSPSKKQQSEQIAFQKELEGLVNNDLYVKSNSFKV